MTTPFTEFVRSVVEGIVMHPDSVAIEQSLDERGVLITLDVHPDDMGKVVGVGGLTADAIRRLLRVVGSKHNARVSLKINDPRT